MPTVTASTPPTRVLLDTPPPKKTFGVTDAQPKQTSIRFKSYHSELELLFSPPVPHTATSPIQLQSTTDSDYDADSIVPQSGEAEDEYTLSAYGDISLSEVVVPPLPTPAHPSPGALQPRFHQPRLRLKVRRPPMPKRRLSYSYISGPLPHSGDMEFDECWPGSPRPTANSPPWLPHQPLVSPLPVDPTSPRTQGNKPVKYDAPSLEKLVDELLPRSPSIRLSPPGSPASRAMSLPQETRGQKSGGLRQSLPEANDAAVKLLHSPPAPAPQQDKPWRTRLPPRPPIPKWDI